MSTLAKLLVTLGLDSSEFNSGIDQAQNRTSVFGNVVKSAAGLAVVGFAAIAGGAVAAGLSGLNFNNSMEIVTAQLNAFTKDGAKSAEILAMIKDRASKTPFAFEEMAKATASLLPAAKASGKGLEELISIAEVLAASNPAEGLEGAAFSLKEALSGDFTSIIERFNLPRQRLKELKAEGVPALEAVQIAMKELGLDTDLVTNLSNTASGRWSTFKDTMVGVAAAVTKPIFDMLSGGLGRVNDFLAANQPLIDAFANTLATHMQGAITSAVAGFNMLAGVLVPLGQYFAAVISDGDVLNDWLTNLPAFMQPAILAIGIFIAALSSIGSSNSGLAQFAPMIDGTIARFQLMQAIVTTVFGALVAVISTNSDAIASKLNSAWSTAVSAANTVFTALNGIVMAVLGQILTFVQTNGADIATTTIGWTSQIVSIVTTAFQLLSGIVQGVYAVILDFTRAHGADIQTVLGGAWEVIKNVINGALSIIGGLLTAALQIFQGNWSGAWQTIQSMSVSVLGNIVGIITGALNIIAGFLGTSLSGIVTLWQNNFAMLVTIATKIAANIITVLMQMGSDAVRAGKSVVDGIKAGISAAWDSLKSWFVGLVKGLVPAAMSGIDARSPSRMFANQVGNTAIMGGILKGMKDRFPDLLAFIGNAGRRILSETLGVMASFARSGGIDVFKSLLDLKKIDPFQPLVDASDALKTAQDQALGVSGKLLDLNAEIAALVATPFDQMGDHVQHNEQLAALYAEQAVLLNEQANAQANLVRLGQAQTQAQAQSVQQQAMINGIAERARQAYDIAQQQALGMMQTNAKGALDFFNKRKAQIEELAQLEKQRALATTDQQRADLDTQIALTKAVQDAEETQQAVDIYINSQDQRAMGNEDIIKIIEDALRRAGLTVDIRTRTA